MQLKKILVAEDTDSNFLLVSIILRKEYQVVRAMNGCEAVTLFQSEKPDLILMDIKMPEMDGLTATREIRKLDTAIPIIALTANAFDSDKQKAIEAGCNDYMAKPIVVGLLTEMIKKYI
ncbi:MAG: response regulator [Alistipes sp.]|nr:response regulator [Alistipes sp.]